MSSFKIGQCWLSDTEQELGIGHIIELKNRQLVIHFHAADAKRTYTRDHAPLTRLQLEPDDIVIIKDNLQLSIKQRVEQDNILYYKGALITEDNTTEESLIFCESELLRLNMQVTAERRLLNGDTDKAKSCLLRKQALSLLSKYSKSPINGLIGPRIDLLPYQFYIAFEATRYHLPRVLLADEVGLGKTIESGLIVHHQWFSEKAKRILVLTPESLVNQWFIELYRRFNMHFSILNEEAMSAEDAVNNPFQDNSLVLCSIGWSATDEEANYKLLNVSWDLIVVDEAHQLGANADYFRLVKTLAANNPGLILISATPDQQGNTSLFELLQLIDPQRYFNKDKFTQEQQYYQTIAKLIEPLFHWEKNDCLLPEQIENIENSGIHLDKDTKQWLHSLADPNTTDAIKANNRSSLLSYIMDQQGTGRVMFRNTRNHVGEFSKRSVCPVPLALPDCYKFTTDASLSINLHPEQYQSNTIKELEYTLDQDPRTQWLIDFAEQINDRKILVICKHSKTSMALNQLFRRKGKNNVAAFNETMSLLERDRASAYFADTDGGQILICSEIGSEGRNFQFCSNLVLFDMPLNPGLLEQRIGRLDRIGQKNTIEIHVLYFINSTMEKLFEFHHKGLNIIQQPCPAAAQVFEETKGNLVDILQSNIAATEFSNFIETVQYKISKANIVLAEGRDRLLEYNSCRKEQANTILDLVKNIDNSNLHDFLGSVFDYFGLDVESDGNNIEIIKANTAVELPYFPNFSENNVSITFDRNTALTREDIQFLSFEHPMIQGLIDLLAFGKDGQSSCYAIKGSSLTKGTIWMRLTFRNRTAPHENEGPLLKRFLPTTGFTLWVDQRGNIFPDTHCQFKTNQIEKIPKNIIKALVKEQQKVIKQMLEIGKQESSVQFNKLIKQALDDATSSMNFEIKRLSRLAEINPSVDHNAVKELETVAKRVYNTISNSTLDLDICELVIIL